MGMPANRRADVDRRLRAEPSEPLGRQSPERRREERRASWRAVCRVVVADLEDFVFGSYLAEVSLEGARFIAPAALEMGRVEVWVRGVDGGPRMRLPGRVTRTRAVGRGVGVFVRFDALEPKTELALAKLLQASRP